jgi:hypothetical protein
MLRKTPVLIVVFTCTALMAASTVWKNVRGLAESSTSSVGIVEMLTAR